MTWIRKKSQPSGDLNPGHVQSRHMPWEPHTNRDGIPFCILPYLTSVTSSGSKSMFCFHYPTRKARPYDRAKSKKSAIFVLTWLFSAGPVTFNTRAHKVITKHNGWYSPVVTTHCIIIFRVVFCVFIRILSVNQCHRGWLSTAVNRPEW